MGRDIKDILAVCDHTLLLQTSTWEEIRGICDDAMKYHTASVCIPPCYVRQAADYMQGRIPVCTVIGFPNGNHTTACKVFETQDAVKNGADEIDMVINVGMLKAKNDDYVLNEIREIKAACEGRILKVIIETCYLTKEEKIAMCHAVTEAKADFIKTSTGFGTGGATFEDVALMAEHIGKDVKIKAAGGVRSKEDMERYIALGCSRIGTSSAIKMLEGSEA